MTTTLAVEKEVFWWDWQVLFKAQLLYLELIGIYLLENWGGLEFVVKCVIGGLHTFCKIAFLKGETKPT